MSFRAAKWNWKNLAARLLLVPVVAGASVSVAGAQAFQPNWQRPNTAPAAAAPTKPAATNPAAAKPAAAKPAAAANPVAIDTDSAKSRLKRARQALAEGKLDMAEELCAKAEQAAAAEGYRWGIFEDSPAGLRRDIAAAADKRNKAEAVECMKRARALLAARAATAAERMQNLDQALAQAHNAKSLFGPTSLWNLGDKPDGLIAEIKSAQEELRKRSGMMASTAASQQLPPPSIPATGTNVDTAAKTEVLKLLAEGRTLLAQDKVREAKAKADQARAMAEAKGLLRSFAANDDTPELLTNAIKQKGGEMVKALLIDCDKQMQLAAYDRAAAACEMAASISTDLGLYSLAIEEKKQLLAKLQPAAQPQATSTAAQATQTAAQATQTAGQVGQTAAATAQPAGANLVVPASLSTAPTRNVMLEQAASELARGELEIARTLAIKAFNTDPAAKTEAQAILRQIDQAATARKQAEAATALTNALAVYNRRDYVAAQGVLMRIDPAQLSEELRQKLEAALADCNLKLSALTPTSGTDDLKQNLSKLGQEVQAAQTPNLQVPPVAAGQQQASPTPPSAVLSEQQAMADVLFDKLRTDGIQAMKAAGEAWEKGDPNGTLQILDEFTAAVNKSALSPMQKSRLLGPIESRQQAYSRMKHNYEVELREAREKFETKNRLLGERVAEIQKQEEIKKKIDEIRSLQKSGKYAEAEALALQLRMLDPEEVSVNAVYEHAKLLRRVQDNKRFREEDEKFTFEMLNDAERRGPAVTVNHPLHVDPERALIAARRGEIGELRNRTAAEFKLEGQLSAVVPHIKFENMPLREALNQLRDKAKINITIDTPTLEDEKLNLDQVLINEELREISLENVLKIILSKARLVHIIENDVVTITTEKRTKGKLKTRCFHVMDLVTPIPEYKLSPHQTIGGAIEASQQPPMIARMQGVGTPTPRIPAGGLQEGQLVSGMSGTAPAGSGQGGQLINGTSLDGPNAMMPQRAQYAQQLKKLITSLVQPHSWEEKNGPGTIEYYDIGAALVVNQTADVIGEVNNLLESLRRLQDLSVSVEIRVISLSEAYFERIGVDFQANVTTNNASFERSLTTGAFRPEPFVNRIDTSGTTVGWSPATGFTSDLAVPIRPTSYNLTAPPFGGYQTALSPTLNGGLSLGLAFLNDIQVYMFLEAAAGNTRINIMQAPKITLFNGQTSTVYVGDFAYFATGLQVFAANGQVIYQPVNQAFPIGNGFNPNNPNGTSSPGVSVTVQAIITADRRFVRLNLTPSLTALASATVPLYPITTFITPVFEGGSQGQPIPFTQFFQQPSFTEISAQTTVQVPDGGTVLLGGLKTMSQGRNEFGPPLLSNIPYLNRLFKNVGIGSETRHVMLMVTPRIIISSEEEARQTGEGIGGALPPQP